MSECQVSQTHVKRPKNIFMQEIFLMQQQNIWLELEMNRFTMIARLVRLNRDLVSGWVVVTNKRQGAGKSGSGRSGLWDYLQLELEPATLGPINQLPSPEACARPSKGNN